MFSHVMMMEHLSKFDSKYQYGNIVVDYHIEGCVFQANLSEHWRTNHMQ